MITALKYALPVILLLCTVFGCMSMQVWSAGEAREYYMTWVKGNPSGWGKMYYRGTDDEYHHFICRPMDSFVLFKVKKHEIEIADMRPVPGSFKERFYYYAVDPEKKFVRIGGE
jgi:hypothetical protein